tara:strand:+ start:338 stop:544 length:207 start_codon:yes stop_codon:yes gene_type:complete
MEWIIIILVVGAIYYGMYRLALSKNRNPWNWILPSILISPIILIIILACCSSLPKKNNKKRKKLKKRG